MSLPPVGSECDTFENGGHKREHITCDLRNTQHKTLKNLSLNHSERADKAGSVQELLRAGLAALLVVVVLLQMDPANAQFASERGHSYNPADEIFKFGRSD